MARRQLVASELFEHAATLFAERGYGSTSLQDIADSIGLSRPALYRYIRSKEDVLAALVADLSQDSARSMAKIRERSDLDELERLREAIRDMALRVATKPVHFRVLVLAEGDLPPAIAPTHARAKREVLDHLLSLVQEATTAGFLRRVDAHVAVFAILGMANWTAWWYKPGGALTPEQLADEQSSIILDGLIRPGPPARRGPREILDDVRQDLDLLESQIKPDR
jgi:AcrR family transcriptional regulator